MFQRKHLFFIVLIFSSVLSAQTAMKYFSEVWILDNLTSIGGYPVTILGNPVVKESAEGKYIEFDGIDDGIIVHGCPINEESEFTIEAFLKPYSSFPENVEQRFLHIQKPNYENRRILLELRLNDKNEWYVDTHIRAESTPLTCLAKEFPHPVDQWYHIAFVYKNGTATHYVNGKIEMTGQINYIPVDSAQVSIGMRMNKRSFFNGAIKSVRITPKALNPDQFLTSTFSDERKFAKTILFTDDFTLDSENWITEFENPATSKLSYQNGKLDLISSAGATIWYKKKLLSNVMITYDVTVVDSGGVQDRVSDLNAFWMATDPVNENIFTRNGKFISYDNLSLYYAGVGGNNNGTSRFRKYHSDGNKPVIQEYLDKEHLLEGNKKYSVKIIICNGRTSYFLNDKLFFDYEDKLPLTEGYFGFRTTKSHQQFDNFKVYKISPTNN